MTFSSLVLHLGDKKDRPVPTQYGYPRATRIIRLNDNTIGVRYHSTDVVIFHADGSVTLDSGGYRTVTTKRRMNDFTRITVRQKQGMWYANDEVFYDGMRFDAQGLHMKNEENDKQVIEVERVQKLTKQINEFTKGIKAGLEDGSINVPSSGDCWYCLFKWDESSNDHLQSHLDESYHVPSLIRNAIERSGSRAEMDYFLHREESAFVSIKERMIDGIGDRVRAYLKFHLGVGR
jgi:hypothetical protein